MLAKVIANTLWHCFSHHQWGDLCAVIYGCTAAYALTHSAWINQLNMDSAYHSTGVGTKTVAILSLLGAIALAQAGSLKLQDSRPGIAAVVTTTILLTTAPSHGGAITIDTTDLSCQLYVTTYITTCIAAHTIWYALRRFNKTEWHSCQQFTANAIAAMLAVAVLIATSVETHRHASYQLAVVTISVPQPANYYTVMLSVTIMNLPSVTLKPANLVQHQLSTSC